MSIGNFYESSNTPFQDSATPYPWYSGNGDSTGFAYYYIDDVSVVPVEPKGLPKGGDTAVCRNDSVRLSTVADSTSGFEWSPSAGLSSDTVSNPLASPDTTTTYTLTKRTCCDTTTAQVTVNVLDTPAVELPLERCVQVSDTVGLAPDTASPGAVPAWSPPRGISDTDSYATKAFPDSTTTYELTLTDTTNSCSSSDSVRVVPYREMPGDTAIAEGDSARYVVPSTGGLLLRWRPYELVSEPTAPDPYLFPEKTTTFTLTKESSCDTAESSFVVRVEEPAASREEDLFVPNVFAPETQGDAENRRFRVRGGPFEEYRLQVFNRWGELVFETRHPSEAWEGRYKGEELPAGVYSYQFRGTLKGGEEVERTGTVTLLR